MRAHREHTALQHGFPGHAHPAARESYRSPRTILAAANALIAHNCGRLGKELWTRGEQGEPILVYAAFNEFDEARFIVERIQRWAEAGHRRSETAILYRSNAQSRVLEEALLAGGMPYRIYGGLRFFERAEIKDTLAYLRLIANRHDDASFERVVNTPTRGIGERTVAAVREQARARQLSLFDASAALISASILPARATSALSVFIQLIERLTAETAQLELVEKNKHKNQHNNQHKHKHKKKRKTNQTHVENLEELVNAARQF